MRILGVLLWSILLLSAVVVAPFACDSNHEHLDCLSGGTDQVDAECIQPKLPSEIKNQCGPDSPRLYVGVDRPFSPLISPVLWIEYGPQGGYHVDVSLRAEGQLNPDLVDISIDLELNATEDRGIYGAHYTRDWYLIYAEESEPQGCYFHEARIFLFNRQNIPPSLEEVETIHNSTAHLRITLVSVVGGIKTPYSIEETITLKWKP